MHPFFKSRWFLAVLLCSIGVAVGAVIILALFRPYLDYKIAPYEAADPTSPQFLADLRNLADARLYTQTRVETLTNGESFYAAELEAISKAARSVHLEAYIFARGGVGDDFRTALTERARRGVKVRLALDAVGSLTTFAGYFDELLSAGGSLHFYHPVRWYTWDRLNNRTHRELIVVDGRTAFVGGAGFADQWREPREGQPPWRDTMFRVTGDAVDGLQSVFVENWLETSGEILDPDAFRAEAAEGGEIAVVIGSTPTAGGSTRARLIYQLFFSGARRSILITNPYFLPDSGIREALVHAVKQRGVEVKVIAPGPAIDHEMTRSGSRRLYGELLKEGVEIHEYQPTMLHTKTIIIDDIWCLVGSTNLDPRSFGLNDELTLLVYSEGTAAELRRDFKRDLANSRPLTYEQWKNRPLWERGGEWLSGLLERQQ